MPSPGDHPYSVVTHSILGVDGTRERLLQALRSAGPSAMARLTDMGYSAQPDHAVAELLLDRALATNPGGVVLMSMFGARHRNENLKRADRALRPEAIAMVAQLLQGAAVAEARR